jgi:endonuclease G
MRVGVISYSAYDLRDDPGAIASYFGTIFNVRRLSYGEVTSISEDRSKFIRDATTLEGNSESSAFDPETGAAVGMHFAGDCRLGNYAVSIDQMIELSRPSSPI